MDTLHDRLAGLAEAAPTGGAPASELWSRGKRARRQRAAALAACLLVVGAMGTGIGVRLADGAYEQPRVVPAGPPLGFTLPLNYPGGEQLPSLGATPGPLAAIWLTRRVGGMPEVVGLVAETGTFGTLSLDLPRDHSDVTGESAGYDLALSPDGRRVAYLSPTGDLVVHDFVTGDDVRPAVWTRPGLRWIDATRLIGAWLPGSDADAFMWQPSTGVKRIDYYTFTGSPALMPGWHAFGGLDCSTPPTVADRSGTIGTPNPQGGSAFEVPQLCDDLSVIGTHTLLGHDHGEQVVALDVQGGPPFSDPGLLQVVALQGAPKLATFATDLIGQGLTAQGGAS
ncbi:MAG: hypothetical protein WAN48_00125 [Actinomycetes bacterium]